MGVQGLWKLLECSGRPINPETLEGKILAVDISIWLNQAIKGARDRQGNAVQNAHLLTLFHRLCKLLFFRIRPIFVFDGEAPLLKKQTLAKRRQRKDNASTEARKTKEKLLKTFLKRQAIKAALLGNKSSNEDFPSLSQVQRKESDDLYALPPLENEDKNSSEEEEEREWEERMNQKQILQEEFFANPSSVDIESEEFNSLPPEVRHEILTDMKEITKRRRTLFEAMPEDSGDFSQYQLKGLLKKNSLNKCIDNVRKEINQQYTGEVQAQFEAEGGFLKEVETRRLVSEDTSHYILIKGINSKEDKKNDDLPTQTVDFNSTQGPKTYLDLKLASARKPKASQTSSGEAAPPSPRTLFAIQEAMMEISSDEELEEKKQPLSEHVGNVSPRTMQAISQVLAEDEAEQSKPKEMLQLHAKERKNRKAMLLVISSSDEEDDRLSTQEGPKTNLDEPFKDNNRVPSSVTLQKSTGNCTFEFTDSQIHHLSNKQNEVKLSDTNSLDINSLGIQNEVSLLPLTDAVGKFADVCASLPSINNLLSVTSVVDSSVTPVNANSNRTIQFSSVLKLQTNIGKQDHSPNTAMDSLQSFDETTGIQKMLPSPFGSSATSVSDLQLAKGTTCTEPEMLQSCSNIVSITQTIKPLEVNHPKEDMENFLTKNDLGAMYVPMTPESIVDRDGEYQTNKEEESDSDGSFIEVESCLSSNNKQHMDIREADDTQETSSNLMVTDAIPSKSQDSSVNNLAECFGDDGLPREPGKPLSNEDSRDAESAENEWQDINLNELESLENNLFVQQTSLQAQRQQQERIAASVTGQMYIESQELLRLFGIPFIVAPMEAEAQCAVLDLTDQTSGTITDDSDIWLFGARHVYKNFFTQNKYVEYYQYSDIHNQLGLDRSKFINLAYLLGSDYTEGIPAVGYVSAMEILNEFPGQGLESLLKFKEWWTDAYQNKKMRPNPNDTKVKKKLRELELHPSFPNPAVANAYLKPVVDESKGAFFWGRPDLEQIREFCESRFGWYQSKTDEVLLPVLKQLNTQQTQLRIDSFFRLEQHETIGLKSQRLRRAVTCMKRKEREKDEAEVEAASTLMKSEFCGLKGRKKNTDFESVKKKKLAKSAQDDKDSEEEEGGFIGGKVKTLSPKGCSTKGTGSDAGNLQSIIIHNQGVDVEEPKSSNVDKSSSSSEDDERTVLVKAKPVFQGSKRKPRVKAKRK